MEMGIFPHVGRFLEFNQNSQDSHGWSIQISDQFQKSLPSKEPTTFSSEAKPDSVCWTEHLIYDGALATRQSTKLRRWQA